MSAAANPEPGLTDWQPSASLALLRARARLLEQIRAFFAERGVLEVETPLLAQAGVTDPQVQLFQSAGRYLQTSPEYAMKRLLASGSGPIYQVCKAFRREPGARLHNPEFSMLEWYRPAFDSRQLMQEVEDLLGKLLPPRPVTRYSYRQLFMEHADIDPFSADLTQLAGCLLAKVELGFEPADRDTWLNLLLTHLVEPQLAAQGMVFVYDYPATQAALARLRQAGEQRVAERFEVYVDGLELANGYAELTDPREQTARLEREQEQLYGQGEQRDIDHRLLQALEFGLPDCAGVALGLDRLLMVISGAKHIREVLAFDWERA